ncbi:hypothetical protein SAMN05216559_1957 [Halomicrobium zhouii]|uniref:Uncharacterized protein n=1 Tax=Halomicrobium zhouii TaxID=767519 RepID=A0A1I6L3K4_9EURY|nr:hypothetical protein SAMN05216559_1957 [Halomicrobium zhouii]
MIDSPPEKFPAIEFPERILFDFNSDQLDIVVRKIAFDVFSVDNDVSTQCTVIEVQKRIGDILLVFFEYFATFPLQQVRIG